MVLKRLFMFIIFVLNCTVFGSNDNFLHLYELVNDQINISSKYVPPINNSKWTYCKNNETYDYGTFDFIIVGAGAAGSILANRLSQIKNWNILLLEAGEEPMELSNIPGLVGFLVSSQNSWVYKSVSQSGACQAMEDQACFLPRGKALGGSTVINGKLYVRGNKEDFNYWTNDLGNEGWCYDEILSCYLDIENFLINHADEGYHSTIGELPIRKLESTIYGNTFYKGMQEIGYKMVDYNGNQQIGFSPAQLTQRGNEGITAAKAFLYPILNRTNLNVTTKAFVTKLLLNDALEAYGVEFVRNGIKYKAKATKEIILSAGSINTPQILMLSGIGPKNDLEKIGVNVIADLPVGKNLEDHPMFIGLGIRTNLILSNSTLKYDLREYLQNRRPLTSAHSFESLAFFDPINPNSSVPTVEVQIVVPPGIDFNKINLYNLNKDKLKVFMNNYNEHSDILLLTAVLHPKSKGTVTLNSKNIEDFPSIDLNYFSDHNQEDIETMYQGVLELSKLLNTEPFKALNASLINVAEYCGIQDDSREYWYCAIRNLTTSNFHQTGTARMGNNKYYSVVDSYLKVHGIKGLRVADASIMPSITSGNTQAPSYVIGEKASRIIKNKYL